MKQTIEVLKGIVPGGFALVPLIGDEKEALLTAITALEALDKAESELGENPILSNLSNNVTCEGCPDETKCQQCSHWMSYSECYNKALPIIAKKELEIEHHNQWAKDIAKELGCSDASKYRNDAIEAIRQLKLQLHDLKEKCSVEKIEQIIREWNEGFMKLDYQEQKLLAKHYQNILTRREYE